MGNTSSYLILMKFARLFLEFLFFNISVVVQKYATDPQRQVYVIVGNSALIKCEIPSFVADFVSVVSWVENNGLEYFPNHIGILFFLFDAMGNTSSYFVLTKFFRFFVFSSFSVVAQKYDTGASDSYIIVGNSALVKCEIPSFVADFVSISSWVDNKNNEYYPSDSLGRPLF